MWLNLYILFGKILHSSHPPLITPGNTTATAYVVDANRPFAQVLEEWTSLNAQPSTLNASYTYGHQLLSKNLP